PVEAGFWREAVDRIAARVLPAPPDPRNFGDLLARLFHRGDDAAWLRRAPIELWEDLLIVLERSSSPPSRAWDGLRSSMADAVRILSARVAALGVASDLRARLPDVEVRDLPFLKLPVVVEA